MQLDLEDDAHVVVEEVHLSAALEGWRRHEADGKAARHVVVPEGPPYPGLKGNERKTRKKKKLPLDLCHDLKYKNMV